MSSCFAYIDRKQDFTGFLSSVGLDSGVSDGIQKLGRDLSRSLFTFEMLFASFPCLSEKEINRVRSMKELINIL